MKNLFSFLAIFFNLLSVKAFDSLKINVDISDLTSPYYTVVQSFTDVTSYNQKYFYDLAYEEATETGAKTTIEFVEVNGQLAEFNFKADRLIISAHKTDRVPKLSNFKIQFKIPRMNKSPIKYPIGLSQVTEGEFPHIVYIGEASYLFAALPLGFAYSAPLSDSTLTVKVPNGWEFWSNLNKNSSQENTYQYSFERGNISELHTFSFLAAPKIVIHEIKDAVFYKKIVSYRPIDPKFISLSDDVVEKMEKSLISKYGDFVFKGEDNAIMWYDSKYFIGRSRGGTVHMSPQIYADQKYYSGAENLTHEIAHVWFGFQIYTDIRPAPTSCEMWMLEGWTAFQALVFMKEYKGEDYFQDLINRNILRIAERYSSVCNDPYASGALMHLYLAEKIGLENYFKTTQEFLSVGSFRLINSDEWLYYLDASYPNVYDINAIKSQLNIKGEDFWNKNFPYKSLP